MHIKESHVDPYKEDNLGFFKKISYNEKLKEVNDATYQAFLTLRDTSDPEQQKFQIWNNYVGTVQGVLNWNVLEKEEDFRRYIEKLNQTFSIFSHPLADYF